MDTEPHRAIEAFKTIKQLGQPEIELHFNLASLYRSVGELDKAEVEIRSVLRHDLNHLEALGVLTDLVLEQGKHRDAILTCNKMLSINNRDPFPHEKLGDAYAALGNNEEAIKSYLLAGLHYASVQDREAGAHAYQRALDLDPSNPTALRGLANLSQGS